MALERRDGGEMDDETMAGLVNLIELEAAAVLNLASEEMNQRARRDSDGKYLPEMYEHMFYAMCELMAQLIQAENERLLKHYNYDLEDPEVAQRVEIRNLLRIQIGRHAEVYREMADQAG